MTTGRINQVLFLNSGGHAGANLIRCTHGDIDPVRGQRRRARFDQARSIKSTSVDHNVSCFHQIRFDGVVEKASSQNTHSERTFVKGAPQKVLPFSNLPCRQLVKSRR